ncbi:hypothetical protein BCR39DRAFT_522397 [Naematelia encephala]|uniref:Uncharacterized protein n=1 Tax=Naematelia encephala TaxID=71784 RepID=A0A1Y2BFR7_9TREE|nr:hypothetical protein BCR39DRAFT_522397 [Naematelia encephala]
MSRPLPLAPDPNKWIDTSTSRPKKPLQRPLASFRNTFATPPSTIRRNAVASSSKDTIKASTAKQTNLRGFFTPPTTDSAPKRRVGGAGAGRNRLKGDDGSPKMGKRKRRDDFWGSSLDEIHQRPLSPDVQDISNEDEEADDLFLPPPSATMIAHIPSSKLPAQTTLISAPSPQIPKAGQRSSVSPPVPQTPIIDAPPSSISERMLTPVPSSVMHLHARLCGQDTARNRRVRSPWRKKGDTPSPPPPKDREKEKKPRGIVMREEVDRRAKSRMIGKSKSLVGLSSSSSDHEDRGMLSPRRINVLKARPTEIIHRSCDDGSPTRNRPVKPSLSRKCATKDTSALPRTSMRQYSRPKSRSPTPLASIGLKPISLDDRISQLSDLPRPNSPILFGLPSPIAIPSTPKKSTTTHHKVTPPKTKSAKRIRDVEETLFAFPVPQPPPQPLFEEPNPNKRKEWAPIDMEPETLMTWSLAGGDITSEPDVMSEGQGPEVEGGDEQRASVDMERQNSRESASLGPSIRSEVFESLIGSPSKRRRSSPVEGRSLSQSKTTQRFPHLIPSSPPILVACPSAAAERDCIVRAVSGWPSRTHTRLQSHTSFIPDSILPANTAPMTKSSKTHRRTSIAGWKALEHGILSVLPPSQNIASPSRKRLRMSQGSQVKSQGQQSKLAAFGFFEDKNGKRKCIEKPLPGFEKAWSDEEEMEVDFEMSSDPAQQADTDAKMSCNLPQADIEMSSDSPKADLDTTKVRLGPVPEAPYHPSLRPAGIRELKRREASKPSVRPPSTDPSSSSLTENLGSEAVLGSSDREWWDHVGNRGTSDVGRTLSDE